MNKKHFGKCYCGKVFLTFDLSKALLIKLAELTPRQCDCDFCMQQQLLYLSHADALLEINSAKPFNISKQGSNQASFLACADCGNIVAVVCEFNGVLKGAVNARLLDNFVQLNEPQIVSPKLLTPQEKTDRWQSVWSQVIINGENKLLSKI